MSLFLCLCLLTLPLTPYLCEIISELKLAAKLMACAVSCLSCIKRLRSDAGYVPTMMSDYRSRCPGMLTGGYLGLSTGIPRLRSANNVEGLATGAGWLDFVRPMRLRMARNGHFDRIRIQRLCPLRKHYERGSWGLTALEKKR